MAEHADAVIAITMFQSLAVGWADLVLPATSFLERDGTTVNLEGRLQRQRRAVIPPCPDELAWIAKLAERFGVELSPHAGRVFEELSERIYGGLPFVRGRRAGAAARPQRAPRDRAGAGRADPGPYERRPPPQPRPLPRRSSRAPPSSARPSCSSSARPRKSSSPTTTRSAAASRPGDEVVVKSNGTSRTLRARVNRKLLEGVVRIADEHAADLHATVEVKKA